MGLFGKIIAKITGTTQATRADWDELENALLEADLGPELSADIVKQARSVKAEDATAALTEILTSTLSKKPREIIRATSGPTSILVVGVNGTGKTTSVAKLGLYFTSQESSVLLCAADTFRAAAVDQLKTWGERLDIDVVHGADRADPASVVFDAGQQSVHEELITSLLILRGACTTRQISWQNLGKLRKC